MRVLTGRPVPADWLAFTPDGRRIAAARGAADGVREGIEFWDLATGWPLEVVPPDEVVAGFLLHPGGRSAYAHLPGRNELAAIDLTSGEVTGLGCSAYGGVRSLAASPDGSRVVASVYRPAPSGTQFLTWPDGRRDRLVCWEHSPDGGRALGWERTPEPEELTPYQVAFHPCGDRFVSFECGHTADHRWVRKVAIRDASGGRVIQTAESEDADALALSPDGRRLVVRSGGMLTVWDARDLSAAPEVILERKPRWASFGGRSIAFHPEDWFLAVTNNDDSVRLYDPSSWRTAKTLPWDVGPLRSVAFSPDGCLGAAGSEDGRIVVWDVDR